MEEHSIDRELNEVRNDVSLLKQRVGDWMETTTEYRKSLCSKLDAIQVKLSTLACSVHQERFKNHEINIRAIWGFIGAIVIGIVTVFMRKV